MQSVFSVFFNGAMPNIVRLALTIPRGAAIWFENACRCNLSEATREDQNVPSAYKHLANHVHKAYTNLQCTILHGGEEPPRNPYWPEEGENSGFYQLNAQTPRMVESDFIQFGWGGLFGC